MSNVSFIGIANGPIQPDLSENAQTVVVSTSATAITVTSGTYAVTAKSGWVFMGLQNNTSNSNRRWVIPAGQTSLVRIPHETTTVYAWSDSTDVTVYLQKVVT